MSQLLITLMIAFIVIACALFFLGLSRFLTGKSQWRIGMCGRDPTQKKDKKCAKAASCGICGKKEDEDDDNEQPKSPEN